MLATYFKQYPASLAAIAKQQAEAHKLPLPDVVSMDTQVDVARSDTARTYTVSEHSEDSKPELHQTPGTCSNEKEQKESAGEALDITQNNTKSSHRTSNGTPTQNGDNKDKSAADMETSDEECLSTTTYNFASPPRSPDDTPMKEEASANGLTPAAAKGSPLNPGCPVHGEAAKVHFPSKMPSSSDSPKLPTEDQLLNCGMCAKRFTKPRVLPCLHTFCEHCLMTYCPPQSLTLTCPVCRQQSILPKDGESDAHSVTSMDDASSHSSSDMEDTTLYCLSHPGQTLRFYCRACETAVCSSCTDIEHQAHSTIRLGDAQEEQRAALQKVIDRVTVQLPNVKECICELTDLSTQLEERRAYAEGQMKTYFKALRSIIDARERELTHSIATIAKMKKQAIEDQREEMESWIRGVEKGCQFLQKAMEGCPAMGLVLVKKQLGEKLMDYANRSLSPAPIENAHLQFVTHRTEAVKMAIEQVGTIRTCSAIPHQTTALVDSFRRVTVNQPVTFTVIPRDEHGQRLTRSSGVDIKVTVTYSSVNNGHSYSNGNSPQRKGCKNTPTHVSIRDVTDGSFEATFTPIHLGVATVSVLLFDQHISCSPFTIVVHPPYDPNESFTHEGSPMSISRQFSRSTQGSRTPRTSRTSRTSRASTGPPASHKSSGSRLTNAIEDDLLFTVGVHGRAKGQLVNPQGVCYSSIRDGRFAVTDSNNQCVQVFTANGEPKLKFGVRGRKAGMLQRPTGIAVMPNSYQYVVSDYENRWVSFFEPTGKYVSRIGHGKLLGPKGICVDSRGNLIIVDNKGSCACLFSPTGKLIRKFGNRSYDENSFAGPHYVAINSRKQIFITDFHNHCIRVFDPDCEYLYTIGSSGEGNGQFNAPTGIAIDSRDNIFVADWGNARVQIFDQEGSFLAFLNSQSHGLYGPQEITIDNLGHIAVADSGNHCVKVYEMFQ